MLYDIRLELHYDYEASVHGDRHLVRVTPAQLREALPFVTEALKDPIGSGWTVESGNY